MSVQVILREPIEHLGRRGDIVKVANGYARNYLLPRQLALPVTEANRRKVDRERVVADARDAEEKEAAEAFAAALNRVVCVIARRVGESEILYGSVTSSDIGEALAEHSFEVDRRKIQLAADTCQQHGTCGTHSRRLGDCDKASQYRPQDHRNKNHWRQNTPEENSDDLPTRQTLILDRHSGSGFRDDQGIDADVKQVERRQEETRIERRREQHTNRHWQQLGKKHQQNTRRNQNTKRTARANNASGEAFVIISPDHCRERQQTHQRDHGTNDTACR